MSNIQKPLRSLFTDLEQAIMSSVWRRESATAEQVRKDRAPKHKLKESTVRTLLGRLEKKGYLKHEVDGRVYVYSRSTSRRASRSGGSAGYRALLCGIGWSN